MNGANRKSEFFSEGRGPGRGADIAEKRGAPKMHGRGVAGSEHMEIDLNDLNKPGVGPVDFDELARGRMIPDLTTRTAGKKSGDID